MHRTEQTLLPKFREGTNGVNTCSWEVGTNEIQVSGHRVFPESAWRNAIQHYLFGVWAGSEDVMIRPKIMFGRITLRLDRDGEYCAYGEPMEKLPQPIPESLTRHELFVGTGRQADVETGLIRFVKDGGIKLLRLYLPISEGYISLWKKERRGQYGVTAVDLPRDW